MATTNEWYQRSVRDYEDKVRDFSADLAFLNEQIQTANNSIAFLRRQRTLAAGNDEEVQQLTDAINGVTSRRNGLELRQADTQQALTQAEQSLAQARSDLARVNQGAPAEAQPLQPPSAPVADPASRQAQQPVEVEQAQFADNFNPRDVSADDTAAIGQFQAGTADDVPTTFGADPLAPQLSPFGEEDEPQNFRVQSSSPEPLGPDISPFGEENEFLDEDRIESFDPAAVTADDFAAVGQFATATPDDIAPVRQPAAPLGLTYQYNDVDGYDIFDADGNYITTVNDEAQAILYIQNAEAEGLGYAADQDTLFNADTAERQAAQAEAARDAAGVTVARDQFTLQQRNNTTTQGDWRVRIRLLPGAGYLYRDSVNYLLQPLRDSDGVVFPYVPTITTNYVARYDPYELVHANYRGFFYKNSHVGEIQINGTFTAQDTAEATYLLAVIHFFRSCTKMFYGQDSEFRGSPPPLVELSGYGEFQFNNHPCLVSNFNYTLPNGVDYIRVSPNNQGVNLSNRRNPISSGGVTLDSVINRLTNNNLVRGAEPGRVDLGFSQGVNGTGQTSYVPTKMEIQLTLLPVQTREQVSKGFRLDEFARGNLLRGGFW